MTDQIDIDTSRLPDIVKKLGDRGRDADGVIDDARDIVSKVNSLLGMCDVNSGLALTYITRARDGFMALQRAVAQRGMMIARSECNSELADNIAKAMQPPKKGGFLNIVHIGLDGVGMVPVLGDFADGANALIYLGQGDWKNALISAGGLIPVAGEGIVGARMVVRGVKDAKEVKGLVRGIDDGEDVLGDVGRVGRHEPHEPHAPRDEPHPRDEHPSRPGDHQHTGETPSGSSGGRTGSPSRPGHSGGSGSTPGGRGGAPSTPSRPGGSHGPSGGTRPPRDEPPPKPRDPDKPIDESPPPDRTPAPGEPGSPEHKAEAWRKYQERGGEWSYDRWSNTYDANMKNASKHHAAADAYKDALNWPNREKTVDTPYGKRRIDIADEANMRGVELKTGDQYATHEILDEIKRDESLVDEGWNMVWVFKGGGHISGPLKKALDDAGIPWVVEP